LQISAKNVNFPFPSHFYLVKGLWHTWHKLYILSILAILELRCPSKVHPPNCNTPQAIQESISSTFYARVFGTKANWAAFFKLHFSFVIFGAKGTCKMLMKLTLGMGLLYCNLLLSKYRQPSLFEDFLSVVSLIRGPIIYLF